MKRSISIFLWLGVMISIIIACESITDQEATMNKNASIEAMDLTYTNNTCADECIDPDNPEYYEKTETKIVTWGNENNPKTKTVEIKYYNTLTHFVLEVRSGHAIADVLMDGVTIKNFDGVIPPDTWQQITFPLDEGWEACDIWSFALEITGTGLPAHFDVEYKLVGACTGFDCGDETITDADGNTYITVLIGDQCWMKQNLRTTKYNDSSNIDYPGSDNALWAANTTGAYAWYSNNATAYKDVYGALYTWNAVNTGKLCPTGWKVPSDTDWKVMETYLGMPAGDLDIHGTYRGTDEGKKLKEAGTTHWNYYGDGYLGTDEYGFTGLPGGYRNFRDGSYASMGYVGGHWTSSVYSETHAWVRLLTADNTHIGRYASPYNNGQSVRCVMVEE